MSEARVEKAYKGKELGDDTPDVEKNEQLGAEGTEDENPRSPSMEEHEKVIKKKYGGLLPRKPLISKDHEHAFFDSADWVLGKQKKNKGPSEEALPPKLEPTHNQAPSRRPSYAGTEMGEEDNDSSSCAGDQSEGSGHKDQNGEDKSEGSAPTDKKTEHVKDHISKT